MVGSIEDTWLLTSLVDLCLFRNILRKDVDYSGRTVVGGQSD